MTIKKAAKEVLAAFDRQIKKDMGFWIKYRPSRWVDLLPDKFIKPLMKLFERKGGKNLILILALILSLILVGIIPTVYFIWSNIFRVWLILLFIPLFYWAFAITSIYTKVIVLALCEFVKVVLENLID